MELRVEELAQRAGVAVDTIRFYQARGLVPRPERRGRIAIYHEAHLEALRRVRTLSDQGFTLAQIGRVLEAERSGPSEEPLLSALIEEGSGRRTYSREELASESGVPEALIRAAESAMLVEPMHLDGEARFGEADLEMARAALGILGAGFPLGELLQLSIGHAQNVQAITDRAIELFDTHVWTEASHESEATEIFRTLLPQVTRLVALHFQRTVVSRALERLAGRDAARGLEAALAATRDERLAVEWRQADEA
jgi:DNA-binding transcriptional MerR regulator